MEYSREFGHRDTRNVYRLEGYVQPRTGEDVYVITQTTRAQLDLVKKGNVPAHSIDAVIQGAENALAHSEMNYLANTVIKRLEPVYQWGKPYGEPLVMHGSHHGKPSIFFSVNPRGESKVEQGMKTLDSLPVFTSR